MDNEIVFCMYNVEPWPELSTPVICGGPVTLAIKIARTHGITENSKDFFYHKSLAKFCQDRLLPLLGILDKN